MAKASALKIKKRCNFCLKPLREDGTCQNKDCPRYVPEGEKQSELKDK